jgi:long-chain fatty acid transport protein
MVIRLRGGASCAAMAALLLAGTAPWARASGFAIVEQGARGMGFAGAFTAVANDPSAIYWNAGGIGFLKGKNLYLGGNYFWPSFDFAGADPFPGTSSVATSESARFGTVTAYYTHQFSERVVFGLGVHSPFALKTDWADPDRFPGRFVAQATSLNSLSINPTVGFRLADRFSVGVGFDFRLASLDYRRKVPTINPFNLKVADIARADLSTDTGTGFGFNLGILAKPSDEWSVGLAYRHKVTVDFTGTTVFNPIPTGNSQLDALVSATLPNGATPFTTSLTFPGSFSGGVAYITDDWTFSGQADYVKWSSFETFDLVYTTRPELSRTLPQDYVNTWDFRLGVERRLTPSWAVRGGYAREKSPVPPESLSPFLPDSNRNAFSAGGSWTNGRARLDAGFRYVTGSERSTEGRSRDAFEGSYKASGLTFGASFGYAF